MTTAPTPTAPADRAERIYQALRSACDDDLRKLADLLASEPDGCNLSGCAEAAVVSPNPVEDNRGCCEVWRAERDIPTANIGPGG